MIWRGVIQHEARQWRAVPGLGYLDEYAVGAVDTASPRLSPVRLCLNSQYGQASLSNPTASPRWCHSTGPRNRKPGPGPVRRIDSLVPTRARPDGPSVHAPTARETSCPATRIPERYMTGISVADTQNRQAMIEHRHAAPRALALLVRQAPGRRATVPCSPARAPPVSPTTDEDLIPVHTRIWEGAPSWRVCWSPVPTCVGARRTGKGTM